jgi:hypothetical protein
MIYEPTLFDALDKPKMQAEFEQFHRDNPGVYSSLVELCRLARDRGIARWGIGRLWEVLRWNAAMQTDAVDYKLNNNHRAFYARMIMEREGDLAEFFETRRSVADA